MKSIKISYVGMYRGFDYQTDKIYNILSKHYQVSVVDSSEAEYIICGSFDEKYGYCDYPQIRIMYVAENYLPDLNFVDYAITAYPLQLVDRCCYYPMFAQAYKGPEELIKKDRNYSKEILREKVYFANFISGHESEYGMRGSCFEKLSSYKRVESPGTYLYNMDGNTQPIKWETSNKTDFQRKTKFTLCFESTKSEGFVTEKIMDAFYADTIPIYYGSDTVKDVFNEKAFINVADYSDLDAVLEKVKELDQDDEKYLSMLRQPIFANYETLPNFEKELEGFLLHIIEQPYDKAYRRSRVYTPIDYENFIKKARKAVKKQENTKKFFSAPIRWIKRLLNRK